MRKVISREVAITEVWLDERARLEGPSVPGIRETVGRMGWREFGTVVLLCALVWAFLMLAGCGSAPPSQEDVGVRRVNARQVEVSCEDEREPRMHKSETDATRAVVTCEQ